jgi:hypothetical protein
MWKCHSETPCIAIIYKQKCLLFKNRKQEVKQVLSGGWYQGEGAENQESVWEGEYGRSITYSLRKMEK